MKAGDTWKGWTIESLIGEGSFGKVYKIVRKEFGNTYESALKVIRVPQNSSEIESLKSEGMSDDKVTAYYQSMIEDIVSEFALMSELRGISNIVSYEDHEVVELENEFGWEIFIRMELLTPMFRYIKKHKLTEQDTIRLGIDICKALEVCSSFNIIHRDIKPENIFVTDRGSFKLGDFGIAKQLDKATVALSRKGTYVYMAPEIYRGEPYNASVDTYSLGLVLYRFLNNSRAPFMPPADQQISFQDREKATVRRMSGEPLPPPCNAKKELADIVLKACAYDPKERYSGPAEMRRDLEAVKTDGLREIAEQEFDEYEDVTVAADMTVGMEDAVTMPWAGSTENKAQKKASKKKKSPVAIILLAAVLLLAAAGAGTYLYKESQKVAVPYVVGMNEDDAQAAIEAAGLTYTESDDFSTDISEGEVMSQTPGQDEKVPKETEVAVVVCRGEPYETPDLTRLSALRAQKKAEVSKARATTEVVGEEYSDDVQEGHVSRQSPEPGANCAKGQVVQIWLSKGREQVTVPDVIGMSPEKARAAMTEAGLQIKVITEANDEVPSGQIFSQSLEPGTVTDHNVFVKVKVSIGSANVKDD